MIKSAPASDQFECIDRGVRLAEEDADLGPLSSDQLKARLQGGARVQAGTDARNDRRRMERLRTYRKFSYEKDTVQGSRSRPPSP